MAKRELKVLILGEVPDVGDIFERRLFQEELPTSPTQIKERDEFEQALDREEPYDLVLIDISPYGIEVLELVREHLPACPVVMIGDPSEGELLLKAKRKGLEAYVLRALDDELFTDLLAEEIYTQVQRFIEPPAMKSPSADQMYRYAQYHNVLEPFFVAARKRYLLYVNKAGRVLNETLHDREIQIGARVDEWVLEDSLEKFNHRLDQAFAGHEVVCERRFESLDESDGLRELHYQPVTDPKGRVVAVSVAVGQPARPERQRARTMQRLSELAAAVSHENNNLLNVLLSNTDLLADRLAMLGDDDALERMEKIQRAIRRATQFTHQLQAFSRTNVSQPELVDSSEVIQSLQASLETGLAPTVDLTLDLELDLPEIWADRSQWQTVVMNLVQNGAKEMDGGGKLHLRTRSLQVAPTQQSQQVSPGSYVVFELAYEGQALADWVHEQSFDPFFTKSRVDRNAGLELATVKSIVEQGGGHIVADVAEEMTTVRIYYPTAETQTSEDSADQKHNKRRTILVVEDEVFLRDTLAEILTSHDYDVLAAATFAEARALGDARGEPVDLLITDVVLSGGSGVVLVEELTELWPQLDVIFISGHPPQHLPQREEASSKQVFLRKPVPIPALLAAVDEFLSGGSE